jgi:hypothetical protein
MKVAMILKTALLAGILVMVGCRTPATKWEYNRIATQGPLTETELNKLGGDGWILSGYAREETPRGLWTEAILRRPKGK